MAVRMEELGDTDRRDVQRFQAGDLDAFDDLYRRNRERLYRYCRYRLGNDDEAEDIVQEAFSRAWKSLPSFGGERNFYPWLRVIASNLCIDAQRRSKRTEVRADVDPGAAPDGLEGFYKDVDVALVHSAFGRLKNRHRDALQLREWEELSYEEIASRVGVSVGTVESLLWRARQAFKRELHAVTNGEGLLGALPLVGLVLRRLRSVRARLAARLPGAASPAGSGIAALSAIVTAGVVAAVVGGGSGTTVPVGPTTAAGPRHLAPLSSPAVLIAPAAAALAGSASSSGSGLTGAAHQPTYQVENPVSVNANAARSEAQRDPTHTSVGPIYVGVDTSWTTKYGLGLTSQVAKSVGSGTQSTSATRPRSQR